METVVINQIKDQSYTMKESLRALKTSISFSGKGVKSILFTSSVPNEGKTTVVRIWPVRWRTLISQSL